jgi:hypothetical protein
MKIPHEMRRDREAAMEPAYFESAAPRMTNREKRLEPSRFWFNYESWKAMVCYGSHGIFENSGANKPVKTQAGISQLQLRL